MVAARRTVALLASAAMATLGGLVLTGVAPTTQTPASAAALCKVTDATLTWGFKASFRAYISGSIAHGDWSTSGNAGYQTPNFRWRKGTGSFDPAATKGQVGFSGGVRFTGHDGVLDSRFSNPRVKFTNARTAVLILDYTGISMEDATSGQADPKPRSSKGVAFASLALASGSRGGSGATTTFTSVPTSITKDGFAAFGSYEPGTALDPITLSITTAASCGTSSTAKATSRPAAKATPKASSRAAGKTPAATPAGAGTPTSPSASATPTIVSATGLAIPEPAARAAATPTADPSTRSLEVIAGAEPGGGQLGDGFLLGLAGFGVGVAVTLLVQFAHLQLQNAHLRLQAKRRSAGLE
ncbi:MAG: HtaA domain-containing protein [Propionicimonas sp.]|nr:HtaA domain-containing protein [Propionicimonas sp.]